MRPLWRHWDHASWDRPRALLPVVGQEPTMGRDVLADCGRGEALVAQSAHARQLYRRRPRMLIDAAHEVACEPPGRRARAAAPAVASALLPPCRTARPGT